MSMNSARNTSPRSGRASRTAPTRTRGSTGSAPRTSSADGGDVSRRTVGHVTVTFAGLLQRLVGHDVPAVAHVTRDPVDGLVTKRRLFVDDTAGVGAEADTGDHDPVELDAVADGGVVREKVDV